MHSILVIGAGQIGSLIATLLSHSEAYDVYLADRHIDSEYLKKIITQSPKIKCHSLDANQTETLIAFIKEKKIHAIVSSLPYYCNVAIAKVAHALHLHYFDLTEDRETTESIHALAKNADQAFVPQCGLAPGFISILANSLMEHFSSLETVKLRVGALPLNVSNALQYALTWSTDGLINEYGNACQAIENGKEVSVPPLEDLEEIKIDGLTYEAFNTSGGLGSLAIRYDNRVKTLNYKTIRYPGHCEKMRFLMNDLQLNHDRETLKTVLERVIPKTAQDMVLIYISVIGWKDNQYIEESIVNKFYPQEQFGCAWTAIQLTTASSLCAVLDEVLRHEHQYHGLITQEQFALKEILDNRFGEYLKAYSPTRTSTVITPTCSK